MNRLIRSLTTGSLACLSIAVCSAAGANDDLFEAAQKAALDGRLVDMQVAYEQILNKEPGSVRALNGKGSAQAWQGNYENAQATYQLAIGIEPDNLDSLIGLGYAYAWAGAYSNAHTQFHRALNIDPTNSSARKGIAYAYYWQGEHDLALESFEIAQSIAPNDAEIEEATGRVNLSLGHMRDAVSHFDRSLKLDPNRHSARLARRSAYTSAPALEIATRVGSTSNAGTGLRAVEVVHWPAPTTRFAARYDNTLGLDNASISDRGEDSPGYFASVHQTIQERWLVGVEVGRRNLTGGNQTIVAVQGAYNRANRVIRLGTQFGRHAAGHTDKLVFGGFNFPLSTRWRLEPTVYLSRTGTAGDDEWRGVINAEYQAQSYWKAGATIGAGRINASDSTFDGNTTVAGLWANVLISDRHTLQLILRREETPTANFTVAELGFTFRMAGN